jgi:hypothetical protein
MVDAFTRAGFQVPLKQGHSDLVGERAWGWVTNLRRRGDVLVADFTDIPAELYAVIEQHGFDHVSAEIYWSFERNGTTFPRVLKAVALLGAETPGVANLMPLRESLHDAAGRIFRRYHMTTTTLHQHQHQDPGQALLALADAYALAHNIDRTKAFAVVRNSDQGQQLLRQYGQQANQHSRAATYANRSTAAMLSGSDPEIETKAAQVKDVDAEIDKLARGLMANKVCSSYGEACQRVLSERPDLRVAYSAHTSR